jgi:hypothetical protein
MTQKIQRRDFLTGSLAAGAAMATASQSASNSGPNNAAKQELCELRIYRNTALSKQAVMLDFVEDTLRDRLNHQGIDRIGIFKPADGKDASVYLLIPYSSPDQLALQNDRLEQDRVYNKIASTYLSTSQKNPAYTRIESRLMRAFQGMPTVVPPPRKSPTRLVELRIYESHNERLAKLKVEMFNKGEIDVMREVGLGPVFFGETLISDDVPNLTYMLSADSEDAHKKHWSAFLKHPEWKRMSGLKRYKGTVSKIVSVFLTPTAASQL